MVDENTTELINGAMDAAMMAAASEDWPAVVEHCDRILEIDAAHEAASRFRQLAQLHLDAPTTDDAPEPAADERRQLTVMFGDMVGSTQMSQVLDPDTLREMLRLYQDACTEAIAAWDGFIARWMGDGFMAYFGFPTPHEDAAYRAVMAGLSVIERIESLADRFQAEFGVEVEEAYLTTLALPANLQVRASQFLTRFGRLNSTHPHAWDFTDQPLVNGRFFGGERVERRADALSHKVQPLHNRVVNRLRVG